LKQLILGGKIIESTKCRIALKGNAKSRSRFGFVVGRAIQVSWELTNIDTKRYDGGLLIVYMLSPSGTWTLLPSHDVPPLNPNQKHMIDRNPDGTPLTTSVLAEGWTQFAAADLQGAILESPPGRSISQKSFLWFFGTTMEEMYAKWALYAAVIGLVGTFVTNVLQILLQAKIL